MKITAEFNSVEELLNFTKTIGVTNFVPQQGMGQPHKEAEKAKQDITPKVSAEIVSEGPPKNEIIVDADSTPVEQDKQEDKEPKVTKEMVREKLSALMKAGKQKEVKELVAKFGASKVPDIKPEDYAAVYKEAEAL